MLYVMLGGVMKEEDFIFNDEPLCNEDDLIDYNKRQASLNYRKILYKITGRNVQENIHWDYDETIENRSILRDLEEQGVKALTKLLDADPPYYETVSDRKPAQPSHTVKVKWENSIVKEREERKKIERDIRRRTNEEA